MKYLVAIAAAALVTASSADELNDPMRPPAVAHSTAPASVAKPVLSAIIGGPTDRIAIVNGQPVRSGGAVGPYTIEFVFEDGVRYRHAGLVQEIHLPAAATFKKASTAAARPPMGAN